MIAIRSLLLACASLVAAPVLAASISIAPGSSVAGYLALADFGIAPTAIASDGYVSFNTAPIVFAGQSWTHINIGENGLLTLGAGGATDIWSAANASLPSGYAAPILAPLWANIDATGGAIRTGVLTDGVSSWTVVDWADVLVAGMRSSFEVWLGQNGVEDVTFDYANVAQPTQYTIAAQDASGTVGTNFRFNSGTVPANSDLRVTTDGLPIQSPVPEPASWAMMIVGFALVGAAMRRRKVAFSFA